MSPRSWRDRFAPARLGKAAILVLVIQLLVTAWTGVVASPDGSQATMPETFSEPEVRTGDRAVYAVGTPAGDGRPTVDGRSLLAVAVEWDRPRWTMTGDGSFHWTISMEILLDLERPDGAHSVPLPDGRRADGRGDEQPSRGSIRWDRSVSVSYDTDRWISTGTARARWEDHVMAQASADRRGVRDTAVKREWRVDMSDPATPCGFHLPFHGGSADPSTALDRVGDCGGNGTLRAVAVEETSGARSLLLSSLAEDPVRVWYAPEIPLPVRWSGPLEALAVRGEDNVTLELSSWDRGTGPTPGEPTGHRPAPIQVETAPRQPWGPAERDLENVSLRLSEAYRILTDRSDRVRTFLDDHPDAYVARAWMYRDRDPADRPRTTWQLVLADGRDRIERFVVRSDPLPVPGIDREVTPPAEIATREEAPIQAPEPDDRYPTPARRPQRLPVVSGDRIPAEDTAGYAPWEAGDAAHYGIATTCQDPDCREQSTVVEMGTAMAPNRRKSVTETAWARNKSALRFGFTPDGGVAYIEGTGKVATGPTVEQTDDSGQAPPTPAAEIGAAPWTFPTEKTAAGISIAAIVAGVLYYLWPKIKLLGAGFYSRIGRDRDEVLDSDVRRRIHEMVQAEPGIHFREIKRRLDTGVGVLEHHLEKLVRADLVAEQRTEAYRCYFPYGEVDRKVMDAAERLRSSTARDVLEAILACPGASATDLADAADLSRSTVGYHLDRLAEAGLVEKNPEGRSLEVEVTELGRRAIDELGLA